MSELGLSTAEAKKRLREYGFNDISEKRKSFLKEFLAPLYSPISLMLLGAAFLSLLNGGMFDFYFILVLYLINYLVQKWQEFKADKAVDQLRKKLFFEVLTLRDGHWQMIDAKLLTPDDRVKLGLGSIIPADGTVISAKNLTVNEAVLTGESLPQEKKSGDKIFSGSFVATGSLEMIIKATGKQTYFGQTIFSIEPTVEKSILERDIISISRFLTIVSIVAVFLLTVVFVIKNFPLRNLLTLDLSLIIAGIPIALPTVMAVILSIGASGLAKKKIITRRLSALEDLANVDLLLTDKTGTLTKNQIRVVDTVSYRPDLSVNEILKLAGYAVNKDTPDAIDLAIMSQLKDLGLNLSGEILNFIPYDGERKRSTVFIKNDQGKFLISLGASQVIQIFDEFFSLKMKKKFKDDIMRAAKSGYRVLAVAFKKGISQTEKNMFIAGLIFLADPLDKSAKKTLRFIQEHGIDVKMLTGDNRVIATKIAQDLSLQGNILSRKEMAHLLKGDILNRELKQIAGFAEILPQDKYDIVMAAKKDYVVAVTGDGVNDLPALRVANVGIAVSGAVSALKSAADIVLLASGLTVIQDAILESRNIFTRLYNYSIYRISESFRLIVSILILGLLYGFYPLVPTQLILLALLNDVPIISLAVDRVKASDKPSTIKTKERFILSLLFGSVGIANSLLLFFLMTKVPNLSLPYIQTMFFLKLTVSGHALIFVAHTKERWWRFLPSKEVIIATISTQIIATVLALTGLLMPAKISWLAVVFVWMWSLLWMQVGELMKIIQSRIFKDKEKE
jgi:H+-transporting ATPase